MISRRFFIVFSILISSVLISFTAPNNLKKKVIKVIKKTFDTDVFELKPIIIKDSIKQKLIYKFDYNQIYKIDQNDKIIGYAYIDKAPSKTDEFDYLILLDKDLIIAKTKILIYREDYGGEIGSKRWLKQFIGKKHTDKLEYEKDIIAISGATISANSMTIAINQFLKNLEILHSNKIL